MSTKLNQVEFPQIICGPFIVTVKDSFVFEWNPNIQTALVELNELDNANLWIKNAEVTVNAKLKTHAYNQDEVNRIAHDSFMKDCQFNQRLANIFYQIGVI